MSALVAWVTCPVDGCGRALAVLRRDTDGYFIAPIGFNDRTASAIVLDAADYVRPLPADRAVRRKLDVWLDWGNETGFGRLDPTTGKPTAVQSCGHNRPDSMGRTSALVVVDAHLIAKVIGGGRRAIHARFVDIGPNPVSS